MKKIIFAFFICFFSFSAFALLSVDVTGANAEPMPIAIVDFSGDEYAEDIRQIVIENLESSGFFRVVDKSAYIQKMDSMTELPVFSDWQAINVQALLLW